MSDHAHAHLHVVHRPEPRQTWAEVEIDGRTLRVEADRNATHGFRWFVLEPGRAGTTVPREVAAPSYGALVKALTGLQPPLRREGLERRGSA